MKKGGVKKFLLSIGDDAAVYISAVLGVLSVRVLPILVSVLNGRTKVDLSGFTVLYFMAVGIAAAIAVGASYAQNMRGMKETDQVKLEANKAAKRDRVISRCLASGAQGAGILALLSSFGGAH